MLQTPKLKQFNISSSMTLKFWPRRYSAIGAADADDGSKLLKRTLTWIVSAFYKKKISQNGWQ